jgi:hypothetical protein
MYYFYEYIKNILVSISLGKVRFCSGLKFFKKFSTKIRLGDHILSTNPDCDSNVCSLPYQEYGIVQAIIHPLYGVGGKFRNDIAILQLDFPAQLNGK